MPDFDDHDLERQMANALERQMAQRTESRAVDRTGWTRQQWIDDARALMDDIDGAITSLVNGHIMALLDEAQEFGEMKARLRAAWPGPEYMQHGDHRLESDGD